MSNEYLSVEEIAEALHIEVGTARNRLSRGDPMPPSCKIGRRRLFPKDELERWLKSKLVSNDDMDELDV